MTDLSSVIHLSRILRWNRAVAALSTRPTPNGVPLNFISMFSGIEAASVAFGPLDWRPVVFAEIEKFPSAVLAHHYPRVPNVGDMSKHDWSQYRGRVDIVCGGPPCQAFSVAGLRESLDDARGNLSLVYMKALHAIKPRNAIVENVPGWLSTKDNAFGYFLAGLVGAVDALPPPNGRRWPNAGMVAGPKGRAAWRVCDAQYWGLAQRRKRVIVVADFGNGADPAAVLFEPESLRRDSPPSRETGQGATAAVAPSLTASGRGVERTGDTRGQDPVVAVFDRQSNCEYSDQNIASADSARDYKSPTDLVCFSAKDYGADASVDLAPTLRAGGHTTSHANAGVMPAIAFGWQNSSSQGLSDSEHIAPTLDKSKTPAITVALRGREGGATAELGGDVATALRASSGGGDKPQHVLTSAVRRLTPRECERLQGFQFLVHPDYPGAWLDDAGRWWSPDYTAIPYNKVSETKIDADWIKYMARGNPKNLTRADVARLAADGPRYKALGNSWAVPKFRWLGERIAKHMPPRS
ncbi:DNA cytosine methyltransferase [Nitrobacteraceae bacterium UC4446_H13]